MALTVHQIVADMYHLTSPDLIELSSTNSCIWNQEYQIPTYIIFKHIVARIMSILIHRF